VRRLTRAYRRFQVPKSKAERRRLTLCLGFRGASGLQVRGASPGPGLLLVSCRTAPHPRPVLPVPALVTRSLGAVAPSGSLTPRIPGRSRLGDEGSESKPVCVKSLVEERARARAGQVSAVTEFPR
jgi:hypothetical protein